MGALAFGVVESEAMGWQAPTVLGSLLAGLVVLGAFVAWARRTAHPAIDLSLFAHATYRHVNLATLTFGTAFSMLFFGNFFFDRDYFQPQFRPDTRPAQPVDATKAPPPRKQEKPPTSTVVVIGDSMADWLAYGLDETLSDTPEMGVVRKVRASSGLVRYEPRSDTRTTRRPSRTSSPPRSRARSSSCSD